MSRIVSLSASRDMRRPREMVVWCGHIQDASGMWLFTPTFCSIRENVVKNSNKKICFQVERREIKKRGRKKERERERMRRRRRMKKKVNKHFNDLHLSLLHKSTWLVPVWLSCLRGVSESATHGKDGVHVF